MRKLLDLLREDSTIEDADSWVEFLEKKFDLENLKKEFGAGIRSEEDYAMDYYNVLDRLSNPEY